MKKKILLLFVLLTSFIFVCEINTKAEILPDNPENHYSLKYLNTNDRINVLRGTVSEDYIVSTNEWILLIEILGSLVESGTYCFNGNIEGNDCDRELDVFINYKDSIFISYEVLLGEELIYKVTKNEENYPIVELSKEIDLYKKIRYDSDNYKYSVNLDPEIINASHYPNDPQDHEMYEELFCYGCPFIYAAKYEYNSGYNDKDVHFVTSIDNPISHKKIIESLYVTDESDGEVLDVTILETDYEPEEPLELKKYNLTLRVSDKSGNIVIQECIVDVADATGPTLKVHNFNYVYYIKAPEQYILLKVEVQDKTKCTKEIIYNEYEDNYNKPGVYEIKIKVTDEGDNYTIATLFVTVYDNKKPVITINNNINISTLDSYTKDDFKKFIMVNDECYGEISEYEIEDADDYLKNSNVAGEYWFKITAKDPDGNTAIGYLKISVHDNDYPEIEFGEYTIITEKGYNLTKEEIVNILIKTGQISSDNVTLTTNYEFYDQNSEDCNLEGEYLLKVTDENGNEFNNKIQVSINEEDDYTSVVKKTNNYLPYIITGISIGLISLITILGVLIYKKKH